MIDNVLVLLRDSVNDYLSASMGVNPTTTDLGQVVFPDSQQVDYLQYKLGAISLIMVNLEQEFAARTADQYRQAMSDGTVQRVVPPIFLNLQLLFVSRFTDYTQSLHYLSLILKYFQTHRVFDHKSSPNLTNQVEKITMELMTLPMAEQHNLFTVLRTTYQPSLLYKARMVIFTDQDTLAGPVVSVPTMAVRS